MSLYKCRLATLSGADPLMPPYATLAAVSVAVPLVSHFGLYSSDQGAWPYPPPVVPFDSMLCAAALYRLLRVVDVSGIL